MIHGNSILVLHFFVNDIWHWNDELITHQATANQSRPYAKNNIKCTDKHLAEVGEQSPPKIVREVRKMKILGSKVATGHQMCPVLLLLTEICLIM